MKRLYLLSTFLLLFFMGCSVHEPNVEPLPLVKPSPAYSLENSEKGKTRHSWWLDFKEPQLNQLILKALSGSLEVKQAAARLIQAQAYEKQARALRLPQIDIGAGAEQEWDEDGEFDSRNAIGALASWELDFFGGLKSRVLAQVYLKRAAEADIEVFRLGITQSVADAFFDVVEQRHQLKLLRQQLKTDRELLGLIKERFEHGLAARIDVLQQTSQVNEAQALIPLADAQLRIAENTLDILLGQAPDGKNRVSQKAAFPQTLERIKTGIPSDLLLRRPDLRRLQAEVVAADAEIGQAMAKRLPTLVIGGSSLFSAGTGSSGVVSRILADLIQPLVDWGSREAEVRRSKAKFKEELLAFTQAYIEAVAEVENGLYQLKRQEEFLHLLDKRVNILEETLEEAKKRYATGLTDYLPVLDAAKELRRIEREQLRQKRRIVALQTGLLVALGGELPPREKNTVQK